MRLQDALTLRHVLEGALRSPERIGQPTSCELEGVPFQDRIANGNEAAPLEAQEARFDESLLTFRRCPAHVNPTRNHVTLWTTDLLAHDPRTMPGIVYFTMTWGWGG